MQTYANLGVRNFCEVKRSFPVKWNHQNELDIQRFQGVYMNIPCTNMAHEYI